MEKSPVYAGLFLCPKRAMMKAGACRMGNNEQTSRKTSDIPWCHDNGNKRGAGGDAY
jgi:hypothetical protein